MDFKANYHKILINVGKTGKLLKCRVIHNHCLMF